MEIANFRGLRVWQAGMALVETTYRLTQALPTSETYGLASQMRRSSISIPSNIAEGHTRESTREYLRHVSIAQASLAELETQLEITARLQYLTQEQLRTVLDEVAPLRMQLYGLRNALAKRLAEESKHQTPVP